MVVLTWESISTSTSTKIRRIIKCRCLPHSWTHHDACVLETSQQEAELLVAPVVVCKEKILRSKKEFFSQVSFSPSGPFLASICWCSYWKHELGRDMDTVSALGIPRCSVLIEIFWTFLGGFFDFTFELKPATQFVMRRPDFCPLTTTYTPQGTPSQGA